MGCREFAFTPYSYASAKGRIEVHEYIRTVIRSAAQRLAANWFGSSGQSCPSRSAPFKA